MPVIIKQSIKYLRAASNAVEYLGNQAHPNHRFHEIGEVRFFGVSNQDQFNNELALALKLLNLERSRSNQVRKPATWWVCAFAPGSYLTAFERNQYEARMLHALNCDGFCAMVWHIHLFSGSADLNFLVPDITLGDRPMLMRSNRDNTLMRLRHLSDAWTNDVNETRQALNAAPIPMVTEKSRWWMRGNPFFKPLISQIGEALRDSTHLKKTPIGMDELAGVLDTIGIRREDWEIDSKFRFLWRAPSVRSSAKKTKPTFRIPLPHLLGAVERYVSQFVPEIEEEKLKNHAKPWLMEYAL